MNRILLAVTTINPGGLPNHGAGADGSNIIANVLTVVFAAAGAVCVLMCVIGGMRYVFSAGDPGKAASARNTLIYSLVGLALCICAEGIVSFILGQI